MRAVINAHVSRQVYCFRVAYLQIRIILPLSVYACVHKMCLYRYNKVTFSPVQMSHSHISF